MLQLSITCLQCSVTYFGDTQYDVKAVLQCVCGLTGVLKGHFLLGLCACHPNRPRGHGRER